MRLLRGLRTVLTAGLLAAILLSGSLAEEDLLIEVETEGPAAGTVTEDGHHLDADGFLTDPEEEYLLEDEENGFWQYASADLAVSVRRFRETKKIKKKDRIVEYCVADIHASDKAPLLPVMTEPTAKHVAGYSRVSPELLLEKHPTVFAMSDDLYGLRIKSYKYQGVVIRNREVLTTNTRNSQKKRPWPNLDTLAVYEDGSMKTFVCDEHTAEEYLAQGATQVFAFGPVLISEGEINPEVLNPKYYPYNEPRVAIGMVEPWHYIAIVVRGRPDTRYAGVHLDWLAQKMAEYGCVEALNLDGGLTATMAFNGKIIQTGGATLRSQGSLITFGLKDGE